MELTQEQRQAFHEVYRLILEEAATDQDEEEEETPQLVGEAT
jgi:hypothetical protein